MLMSPNEAKKRFCPLFGAGSYATPHEPDTEVVADTFCLADRCMMWRWEGTRYIGDADRPTAVGYCGLAGDRKMNHER